MKWSIKSLLIATLLIGITIATIRSYAFPLTFRVHIAAPGEYQIGGKNLTALELENRFINLASKSRFRIGNARLEVTLPPGATLDEFESEIDTLKLLGARAQFSTMQFSRGITE